MEYVVLDTDVASLIQKERLPTELAVHIVGKIACITFVTVAELHSGQSYAGGAAVGALRSSSG